MRRKRGNSGGDSQQMKAHMSPGQEVGRLCRSVGSVAKEAERDVLLGVHDDGCCGSRRECEKAVRGEEERIDRVEGDGVASVVMMRRGQESADGKLGQVRQGLRKTKATLSVLRNAAVEGR